MHIESTFRLAGTPNRYTTGLLEVALKDVFSDKTKDFRGRLNGIKGQYLIFEDGSVINIRKYRGYYLEVSGKNG